MYHASMARCLVIEPVAFVFAAISPHLDAFALTFAFSGPLPQVYSAINELNRALALQPVLLPDLVLVRALPRLVVHHHLILVVQKLAQLYFRLSRQRVGIVGHHGQLLQLLVPHDDPKSIRSGSYPWG